MLDLLIRFLVGGTVVSFFAMLGDVLRPKSFAGLFAAAPSVALATLSLTIHKSGRMYASQEANSMLFGSAAFVLYAYIASLILRRHQLSARATTVVLMPAWFGAALGLLALVSGRP